MLCTVFRWLQAAWLESICWVPAICQALWPKSFNVSKEILFQPAARRSISSPAPSVKRPTRDRSQCKTMQWCAMCRPSGPSYELWWPSGSEPLKERCFEMQNTSKHCTRSAKQLSKILTTLQFYQISQLGRLPSLQRPLHHVLMHTVSPCLYQTAHFTGPPGHSLEAADVMPLVLLGSSHWRRHQAPRWVDAEPTWLRAGCWMRNPQKWWTCRNK